MSALVRRKSPRWASHLVLVATFGMLASGCLDTGQPPELDHSHLNPIPLVGTLLSAAPAIGIPSGLQVTSDVLWVADARRDPALHVLSVPTGELLHSFGRRGDGPGDFVGRPFALLSDAEEPRAIWAYDQQIQRLTRFKADGTDGANLVMVRLEGSPRPQRLARVGPERVIGVTQSVEARFVEFETNGKRLSERPGELNGPETAPVDQRWMATNQAINVCEWPRRGFVIANHGFGRLEFYDIAAARVRNADVPFPSNPIFDEGGRYQLSAGYLDCTATADHVYAIFPGRNRSNATSADERERAATARFVHVFDWEGRLRAVFELDRAVGAISVDPSGKRLFASSFVDSGIYGYELPPVAGPAEERERR